MQTKTGRHTDTHIDIQTDTQTYDTTATKQFDESEMFDSVNYKTCELKLTMANKTSREL